MMKPRATFGALIWLPFAIAACNRQQPPPAEPVIAAPAPAMPVLDRHAESLVAQHAKALLGFSPARKTSDAPLSYGSTFTTDKAELLTADVEDGDIAAAERNRVITARWQQMYCTDELKEIMRGESIAVASGQLVDAAGKGHSLAMCSAGQPGAAPPPAGQPLADVGPFSTGQICKAALALVYGRDPSIMSAKAQAGHVQVAYTRPSDDRQMRYRCRLENGHVLTWDDSIAGARWYGGAPGDSQLAFQVTGERLHVQDILKGEINREKSYSSADIARDD